MMVELPFPPASLNPNRKNGRHWGTTHGVKTDYRTQCWALTLSAMQADRSFVPPAGDIPLRVTFVQPDKRQRDRDNLLASIKSGLDGLAAALKVDDSRFEPVTICRQFGTKPGAVLVEVGA
jgi:crossover junction endodeoxyribonuclease RusA